MRKGKLLYLAIASLFVAACSGGDPAQSLAHATLLSDPRPVGSFQLIDQHGREVTRERFRGRWSVLFTGFTYCPDICPTTMAMLLATQKRADLSGDLIQVVFVSVDPERDTPEVLAGYLDHFDPNWTALTGSRPQISKLLDSLEMAYVRVPMGNGDYTMDHSTALVLIDPEGRMRGYFKAPIEAAALAEDLTRIARARR